MRLLLKLEKFTLADVELTKMIHENPDNADYFSSLEAAKQLDGELNAQKRERLHRLYQDLATKYPRSTIIQQLPMKYASGDVFRKLVSAYLQKMFRKGVPSLYNSLKEFLQDSEKSAIIQEEVEKFHANLSEFESFDAVQPDEKEAPNCLLWVLFFLAQLYDGQNDIENAMKLIDAAIEHTPTAVELYLFKARIFKVFEIN